MFKYDNKTIVWENQLRLLHNDFSNQFGKTIVRPRVLDYYTRR